MPLISNSPGSFPSCQASGILLCFPSVGPSSPTQTSWVRQASLLSQKWIQAWRYQAENRREQRRNLGDSRACELSNSHSVGPLFWKGTSQEIKSPLYHRTHVASRKSTQFREGESFEEHRGYLTIRSPASKCFTAYPVCRYHCSKERGMLGNSFYRWRNRSPPNLEGGTLDVFSPCIAFCPRSKAMISSHHPPSSWHFHL